MLENLRQDLLDVLQESEIEIQDIPNIPLYMDQILMMMDTKLQDNKIDDKEKIMTKTMINNYSKAKIIKPIKGKTYSKEQILQILMVYRLKNSLSMQQMKQVMKTMYDQLNLEEEGFERCYKRMLKFRFQEEELLMPVVDQLIRKEKSQNLQEDALVSLLCLSLVQEQLHKVANQIVNDYFHEGNSAK
ncbi:MAG: DUF1836 domain-containing protein [Erysipelotrichaceae bacterium]|nr:DUF1836 domain-containing protein [Erysipelotrichaceae bacterium]